MQVLTPNSCYLNHELCQLFYITLFRLPSLTLWSRLSSPGLLLAPTGLLALQGNDHHGKLIRKELVKVGVETKFIEGELFNGCLGKKRPFGISLSMICSFIHRPTFSAQPVSELHYVLSSETDESFVLKVLDSFCVLYALYSPFAVVCLGCWLSFGFNFCANCFLIVLGVDQSRMITQRHR